MHLGCVSVYPTDKGSLDIVTHKTFRRANFVPQSFTVALLGTFLDSRFLAFSLSLDTGRQPLNADIPAFE